MGMFYCDGCRVKCGLPKTWLENHGRCLTCGIVIPEPCEELKESAQKSLAGLHLAESIGAHLKRLEKGTYPYKWNPKVKWDGKAIWISYVWNDGQKHPLTARQAVLYLAQLEQGATERHYDLEKAA